ncbi:MAG: DUF1552 domain-containing protein [Acidimicrobiia bacterium]|nr:DUF1552 domain-containing protein [Acidimicrobiia bacterium]
MIISKRSLSRRTVLRGIGTTLALPLLDAMVPALTATARTAAGPVRRLGVVYVPNGIAMEYWTPATVGRNFELTPILEPLAPYRDQMLVVTGTKALWTPAHAGASTTFLTGWKGVAGETQPVCDISMDQVAAREFSKETELASLELAIEARANAGQCSGGHSCVYTNTISWLNQTTPLPMENNPRAVFERMFGDTGSTDPAVRAAQRERSRSVLDSVNEKIAGLNRDLGASDRIKLDEYLEGIRDIERRISMAEQQSVVELPVMERPEGAPQAFDEHVRLMFDLQLLAYRTDLTRVITFMVGREVSSRTYPEIGVSDAHHPLSHHEYDPQKVALNAKINTYHMSLFAEYLEKLRATRDGDQSLLDSLALIYGCGMSDGNAHSPDNIPVLVLGGASGHLRGNRHLKFDNEPPLANLMVSVLDKVGVPVEKLGNSTGPLQVDTLPDV